MRSDHWIYTVPLRLRSLFRRNSVEQELEDELRFHIERKVEEEIAKGRTPEEASNIARPRWKAWSRKKKSAAMHGA